jgi:hypothetical protein
MVSRSPRPVTMTIGVNLFHEDSRIFCAKCETIQVEHFQVKEDSIELLLIDHYGGFLTVGHWVHLSLEGSENVGHATRHE